jgi:general secretion pathway protein G
MPTSSVGRATKKGTPAAAKVVLTAILAFAGVSTLASLVAPALLRHGDRERVDKTHADIAAFKTALATYRTDTGEYPTTAEGLRALREKPQGVKGWDGPYVVNDVPKDAWGHDYVYRYPGQHGDEPDIICYGADGQPGGDGINADIVSWAKP